MEAVYVCTNSEVKSRFQQTSFVLAKMVHTALAERGEQKNEVEFCSHYIPQAVYEEVYLIRRYAKSQWSHN